MTKNQINNIFYFLGILKIEKSILHISPDYLLEKSCVFLGKPGKDYFVPVKHTTDSWVAYCSIWQIDKSRYEILNIINFITSSNFTNPKNTIKNFEKFIGDTQSIPDYNLCHNVHPKSLEHFNKAISNNRYLKLLTLE